MHTLRQITYRAVVLKEVQSNDNAASIDPDLRFKFVNVECVGACWSLLCSVGCFQSITLNKFPLVPMGVLAPGSAHARPSARPPINTSGIFLAYMSGGEGKIV